MTKVIRFRHKGVGNPKGKLAKEMEIGLRRSVWLSKLCVLWTLYNNGDKELSGMTTPYIPPPHIGAALGTGWDNEMSKVLGRAIKGCEIWEPPGEAPKSQFRLLKSGPKVTVAPPSKHSWHLRAPWSVYYQAWSNGGLDRGISTLMKELPRENRMRIKKLLDG